jgi:uncharacterized protein YjbI with pentapeptide repeats
MPHQPLDDQALTHSQQTLAAHLASDFYRLAHRATPPAGVADGGEAHLKAESEQLVTATQKRQAALAEVLAQLQSRRPSGLASPRPASRIELSFEGSLAELAADARHAAQQALAGAIAGTLGLALEQVVIEAGPGRGGLIFLRLPADQVERCLKLRRDNHHLFAALAVKKLRIVDLQRAHLNGVNLHWANLSGADLSGANLSGADLSGADLTRAVLRLTVLAGANLSSVGLARATLSGANLSGATLSGATLRWANLSGADLSGATLSGADLRAAVLVRVNLAGAVLTLANLRRANLSGADLSGANLSGANLHHAILTDVTYTKQTIWPWPVSLTFQTLAFWRATLAWLKGTKFK